MRPGSLTFVLVLILFLALPAAPEASGPGGVASASAAASALATATALGLGPAWSEAVERWSAGQSWKPARMTIRSQEIGKDGAPISEEETLIALRYPEGPDKPVTEILKATKDGKDVTAERRAKAAKGGAQGGPGGPGGDFPDPIPFAAAALAKTRLSDPKRLSSELEEFGYEIAGKNAVVGRLRFSRGRPLSLSYVLEPLPFYLKGFSGAATFASAPDGSLVASELSFDADADLLLIKKRFRFSLGFEDWVLVPPAPKKR